MEEIKCVFVGNYRVGKSSIIGRYAFDADPRKEFCYPSCFNYKSKIDGEQRKLILCNALSDVEDFFYLPEESPLQMNVYLVCFSLVNPRTFKKVQSQWVPTIREKSQAPIILVGTKLDLRKDQATLDELRIHGQSPITYQQGLEMAKEINAIKYLECSALTKKGIQQVFKEAVRSVVPPVVRPSKLKRSCILL